MRGDEAGNPGEVIGVSAPLGEGIIANVPVPFFTDLPVASTVHATVHIDMNGNRVFDYEPPDGLVDVPAERDLGEVATATAAISLLAPLDPASIEIAEQSTDGTTVTVGVVDLPADGFVVIQSDDGGAPGLVLGVSELLPTGENTGVVVELDTWLAETEDLWAVAWVDRDGDGIANIEAEDTLDGVALTFDREFAFARQTINVIPIFPVTLSIDHQEGDGSNVRVALVTMPSAGFIEVLDDEEGEPGARIGLSGLLPRGTSTDIEIELDEPLTSDGALWVRVLVDYDGNEELGLDDLQGFISPGEEALVTLAFTIGEGDDGE